MTQRKEVKALVKISAATAQLEAATETASAPDLVSAKDNKMEEIPLDANEIFASLENARKQFVNAYHEKLKAERGLEAAEAEAYKHFRKEGESIEDSKRSAKLHEAVKEWSAKSDMAAATHLGYRFKYENLVILSELRRSQESTRRTLLK